MRKYTMLVAAVALAVLVFAPATAFAQDDNPSADDLLEDDRGGEERGFDDNPTGEDVGASPTATATPTSTSASPTSSATPTAGTTASASDDFRTETTALPDTGGASMVSLLSVVAGVLLIGSGIVATVLLRRRAS